MKRILKKADYLQTIWKNGLGKTQQIAVFPSSASVVDNNFDYRLSSAKITADCEFSSFPGYDRVLIIWQGEKLMINGQHLPLHQPYFFHGEDIILATLGNNIVIDVGLIYQRKKFKVEVKNICSNKIDLEDGYHFIFLVNHAAMFDGKLLDVGETLEISGSIHDQFNTDQISTFHYYLFSLYPL